MRRELKSSDSQEGQGRVPCPSLVRNKKFSELLTTL
jgi:hypothetical protein